jgi:predicted TIM-barrel fold metal-dependent hydrolase
VHLEISALGRPFLKDENGADLAPDPKSPQLPYVVSRIKEDGLVAKTIFGSDGPQFSGMVKGYVTQARAAMSAAGYTEAEQKDVMGRNFTRLFFRAR